MIHITILPTLDGTQILSSILDHSNIIKCNQLYHTNFICYGLMNTERTR